MMKTENVMAIFVIAVLVLIFAPWISFWAINALIGYAIPYTFKTWFAFWLLQLFLFGNFRATKES